MTINSHPKLQTSNINKFIFPGKFSYEQDPSINRTRIDNLKGEIETLKQEGIGYDPEKAKTDQERTKVFELQRLTKEYEDSQKYAALARKLRANNRQSLIDELRDFRITQDNFEFEESGIPQYLFMKGLDEITNSGTIQDFATKLSRREDKERKEIGILRNIFINVKHLQDIFSTPGSTLGDNMNLLFSSLAEETGGLIDLVVVADQYEEGCLKTESRGVDTAEANKIDKIKESQIPGIIYNFPVWQSDSFIKSQEISSDISSESYKILLGKSYAERIALEKKKGISLVHHANINSLDKDGIPIDKQDRYRGIIPGVRPAFLQGEKFENYGQKDGDVDFPLTGDNGISVVPDNIITQANFARDEKARKNATDKDFELANSIHLEAPTRYTVDGRLKSNLYDEMKEAINFRIVTRKNDNDEEYQVKLPNIDDYGMVGITNTIAMAGIAGIRPSDIYTTSYLPTRFKEFAHFYTTEVSQECDSSTWTTTLTGRMTWKYVKRENEAYTEVEDE